MAEKPVSQRRGYSRIKDTDNSSIVTVGGFWRVVRSMTKYLANRVAWGFDVTTGETEPTVAVGQGGCIQNRYYRFSTGGTSVSIGWSGSDAGKTVIYVESGTGNIVPFTDIRATLSTSVPDTALILAYVDTRQTWGSTGWTAGVIDNNARPALFDQTRPFIYWK